MEYNDFDLFIFAGEPSGDLHGEELLKALYKKNPQLRVFGVGGPRMRSVGMECIMPMEKFQVMGFIDVFLVLPKLIRQFYQIRRCILDADIKGALFIDYPGFNLRMEEHLRRQGYKGKLFHYICPSVWAWGEKRIPQMAKNLDLLMTIFPFEKEFFSKTSLKVQYVGHPLIKRIREYHYQDLPLPKDKRIVGIFPGSRKKEILRNTAVQLKVAKKLMEKHPDLFFAVSISQPRFLPLVQKLLKEEGLEDHVVLIKSHHTYDLMKACDLAIAKSGTVTLELALHLVPTVVTYGISTLDLFIAKTILKINLPFYCIVNIVCNTEVFPELFGPHLTEENLYLASDNFLSNPEASQKCREKCENLWGLLQDKDASDEASSLVLKMLDEPNTRFAGLH